MKQVRSMVYCLCVILGVALLTSCVPEEGPVVANGLEEVVHIKAEFDDGYTTKGCLPAGKVVWLAHEEAKMTSLIVSRAVTPLFNADENSLLLWQLNNGEELFVLAITQEGVKKVSRKDLRDRAW